MVDDDEIDLDALDDLPVPAEPKRHGNAYVRDDAVAEIVKKLARLGLTDQHIADYFQTFDGKGPAKSTIQKHYKNELDMGRVGGVAFAASKLMEKIREGNLSAIIFYLKSRGDFIETRGVQVRDKHNQPSDIQFDFSDVETQEELDILEKYFGKYLGNENGHIARSATSIPRRGRAKSNPAPAGRPES